MKKLFTFLTAALSYLASGIVLAHPGHEAGSVLGQAAHAFSAMDYFLGSLLLGLVIYHLIKRTQ
jgi:hypothetical protein